MTRYEELNKTLLHINIGQAAEDELHMVPEKDIETYFINYEQYFQTVPKHLIEYAGNNPNTTVNVLIVSPNDYKYGRPYMLNEDKINILLVAEVGVIVIVILVASTNDVDVVVVEGAVKF